MSSGGATSAITVNPGGLEAVFAGSVANTTSLSGAFTFTEFGADIVFSRGEQFISGGTASGTVVNGGGTEVVFSGGTTRDSRVLPGGAIDLRDVGFNSGGTAVLNLNTNILTVTEGGNTSQLLLARGQAGFMLSRDDAGGTLLTATATATFLVEHTQTGVREASTGQAYIGPVAGLRFQYIDITPKNLNVTAGVANTFIHTGDGFDAINVSAVGGASTSWMAAPTPTSWSVARGQGARTHSSWTTVVPLPTSGARW